MDSRQAVIMEEWSSGLRWALPLGPRRLNPFGSFLAVEKIETSYKYKGGKEEIIWESQTKTKQKQKSQTSSRTFKVNGCGAA